MAYNGKKVDPLGLMKPPRQFWQLELAKVGGGGAQEISVHSKVMSFGEVRKPLLRIKKKVL